MILMYLEPAWKLPSRLLQGSEGECGSNCQILEREDGRGRLADTGFDLIAASPCLPRKDRLVRHERSWFLSLTTRSSLKS